VTILLVEETAMTKSYDDRVRARAHQLWEREGRPEGQSERHWAQARTMLAAEHARKPVSPSKVVTRTPMRAP
jgi:hypothetical protein